MWCVKLNQVIKYDLIHVECTKINLSLNAYEFLILWTDPEPKRHLSMSSTDAACVLRRFVCVCGGGANFKSRISFCEEPELSGRHKAAQH